MIVKMIQNLGNRMEAWIEKITEMKNTLEGISSRITVAEERISDLEDRKVEITEIGRASCRERV